MNNVNEFQRIETASKLFNWDTFKEGQSWGRIFHKGECSLHDYERGFYYIKIYVIPYSKWNGHTYVQNGNYSVRVWYQTIDDGDFGGWYQDLPLKDAQAIAQMIKDVYDPILSLPSDEKMNELLAHTGMIIGYE